MADFKPVLELRVALTVDDYDKVLAFYQDALGIEPAALWTNEQGQAVLFEMGRGTLELFDQGHADEVDEIEVGHRVSGAIRFALQVPDVDAALARVLAKGAALVHEPVVTPWNDKNARVMSPDGMQITLFQVMGE